VRGRCPWCEAKRQAARLPAAARGYDWPWTKYADRWLRRFPWCGQRRDGELHADHSRCAREGLRVRAECVDHIRTMADGGAKWNPDNHQSLCRSCNVAKAVRLEGFTGRS
jgi:5-methylcytosine-specific restriction endonuclease McrA